MITDYEVAAVFDVLTGGGWIKPDFPSNAIKAAIEKLDAIRAVPAGATYYAKGKDAGWFEALTDEEFAERATHAAQDLADSDIASVESWIPIVAIVSVAADRIRRLVAAPAVKPLEWQEPTKGTNGCWTAKCILGTFYVAFDDGWHAGLEDGLHWEWESEEDPRSYHGPLAAQRACQAYLDRCISSALSLQPAGERVAFAWTDEMYAAFDMLPGKPRPFIDVLSALHNALNGAAIPFAGRTMKRPNLLKTMQAECDRFNARFAVGDDIAVWTGVREGNPTTVQVRYPAQIMSGHTAVVYVTGGGGCVALSHVKW